MKKTGSNVITSISVAKTIAPRTSTDADRTIDAVDSLLPSKRA